MKPHSLGTWKIPGPVAAKPGPLVERYGHYPKGTVLPETTVPHSPRRKVADFPPGKIKTKWIEQQEQNQLIASCCRHPENHEIEAMKSHPDEPAPDIYIFHCTCGRRHIKFCIGMDDERLEWR
jgi:hypothetical protein